MFTDTTRLENACQAKLQAGTTIDEVIVYLHDQGLSILDTIKVIRQVERMSLGDAKQIVSNHTVWQQSASLIVLIEACDWLLLEMRNQLVVILRHSRRR